MILQSAEADEARPDKPETGDGDVLHIQFFPFRNFSFEFLFNCVVFIQYWIKMIHPVMDHFFLHLIVEQMILCKNHVIADCFQCFCYYWNRFF